VKAQLQSFDFLFGVSLGYDILRHTNDLRQTLQTKELSAAEDQHITEISLSSLSEMRKEESFNTSWEPLNSRLDDLDVHFAKAKNNGLKQETPLQSLQHQKKTCIDSSILSSRFSSQLHVCEGSF
jgi:hypothetical protein